MLASLRHAISRRLCPEIHQDAERYHRMRGKLDSAVQWLGIQHPEGAAVAQWAIDQDRWYWTSTKSPRHDSWTWQPPEWISDIGSLRSWLATKPFPARQGEA